MPSTAVMIRLSLLILREATALRGAAAAAAGAAGRAEPARELAEPGGQDGGDPDAQAGLVARPAANDADRGAAFVVAAPVIRLGVFEEDEVPEAEVVETVLLDVGRVAGLDVPVAR